VILEALSVAYEQCGVDDVSRRVTDLTHQEARSQAIKELAVIAVA
jgi:hypothetical protein